MSSLPTGTVTFLFTDLVESTRLWEQNPRSMQEAMAWHDQVLRSAIAAHDGYIFSTAGDGLGAAFDDPMQAAAAAVEAQQALASREWGDIGYLKVRMGLDTGIAQERDGDYFGPAVNRAARVMGLAGGGEVLASHTAADLLRHHLEEGVRIVEVGERKLRGVTHPEIIFAVEYGSEERGREFQIGWLAVGVVAGVLLLAAAVILLLNLFGNGEETAGTTLPEVPTTAAPNIPATDPDADPIALTGSGAIVFETGRDGNFEVYAMGADGSNPVNLSNHPAWDGCPAWSPDGGQVVFISERDGNREVYAMLADGTNQTRLTNTPGDESCPRWSPDGSRIAYDYAEASGRDVFVMGADGANPVRLTNTGVGDCCVSWSPDGTRLAFESDRSGNTDIWTMGADGSAPRQVTTSTTADFFPAVSPDGSRIAFTSDRFGQPEIFIIDVDGSNEAQLTVSTETFPDAFSWQPAWSPDGSAIVFNSDRDGPGEIYAMNADGSGVLRISFTEPSSAFSAAPQWSPAAPAGPIGALQPIPVRIGAIMNTSIPEFPSLEQPLRLAESEFNSAMPGLVALDEIVDSGDDGAAAIVQLLESGHDAVIGDTSGASEGVWALAVDGETAICAGTSPSPLLSNAFYNPYGVRTVPSDELQARALAGAIADDGITEVAVAWPSEPYEASMAAAHLDALGALGIQASPLPFDPASSIEALAAQIAASNPPAVTLFGHESGGAILEQLRSVERWGGAVYVAEGFLSTSLQGERAQFADGVSGTALAANFPGAEASFSDRFAAFAPGVDELRSSPHMYDCLVVLVLAAQAAQSSDPAVFAGHIVGVTRDGQKCSLVEDCLNLILAGVDIDYDGASGPLEFTGNGEPATGWYDVLRYRAEGTTLLVGQQQGTVE